MAKSQKKIISDGNMKDGKDYPKEKQSEMENYIEK